MANVIKNQELNQSEQLPIRGFLVSGSQITGCIDSESTDELHIGDFISISSTSGKGISLKKTQSGEKPFGIITNNSRSDTFSNKLEDIYFSFSRIDSGAFIYVESGEGFKKGDSLELDSSERLHRVKKKTGANKQVGIALEDASGKGDIVLIDFSSS